MRKYSPFSFKLATKLFRYNPKNGKLYWRVPRGDKVKIGDEVGTNSGKYRTLMFKGKAYKVHRIIWLLKTGKMPKNIIDHIDHNGLNNRFKNLRDIIKRDNHLNQKLFITNKSGFTGVSWDIDRKKWFVNITINKKSIALGRYTFLKEAIQVRKAANKVYGFHKNHGQKK